MICVEGYEPISVFWRAARSVFHTRVREERWKRIEEAQKKEEPRPQFPFADWNCEIAAQLAVYELFSAKYHDAGKKPKVLRPDGVLMDISVAALDPRITFSHDFELALVAKYGQRLDGSQSVDAFLEALTNDYWVDLFLASQCFIPRKLSFQNFHRTAPIVNWKTSTLDLGSVRCFEEGFRGLRDSVRLLSMAGIERIVDRRTLSQLESDVVDLSALKPLMPFDGCTIMAPTEWLKELTSRPREAPLRNANDSPVNAILRIAKDTPGITKREIKSLVCAEYEISDRQCEKAWSDAVKKNSALSSPGPRKKNSSHLFE
jgi:hypothetical protein